MPAQRVAKLDDRAFRRALKKLGNELPDATEAAGMAFALVVQNQARELAPVDTGRLKSSIAAGPSRPPYTAEVGSNVRYAPHVEFGTYKMRAQPFMRPAITFAMSLWPSIVRQKVDPVLRKARG